MLDNERFTSKIFSIDFFPEFETDFVPSRQAPQFIQSAPTNIQHQVQINSYIT